MKPYATYVIKFDGETHVEEFNSKTKAIDYGSKRALEDDVDVVFVQVGDGDEIINIKL